MHRLVCVVVVILWLYARLFRYLHIASVIICCVGWYYIKKQYFYICLLI